MSTQFEKSTFNFFGVTVIGVTGLFLIEKGCFAFFGVPEDLFKGEISVCFADIGLLTSLEALGDLFFFDGCLLCVRLKRERNFLCRLFFF